MEGGAGNDILLEGAGNDTLSGGNGKNTRRTITMIMLSITQQPAQ